MESHTPRRTGGRLPVLLTLVHDPDQAVRALDEGADMVDAGAAAPAMSTAIRACLPQGAVWAGDPAGPVDADTWAPGTAGPVPASPVPAGGPPADAATWAEAVTVAAISTWLGATAVRTRHTRAVRRAIDMAGAIAGTRPPSLTVRGLG